MENPVLVFVKFPEPGKVKTRLAAGIGGEAAAQVYRSLTDQVLSALPDGEDVRVVFDPPGREDDVRRWLAPALARFGAVEFWPQAAGGLGRRLADAFAHAFVAGRAATALAIGTDCIDLAGRHLAEARDRLAAGADVVFGPALDGGYYLIGMSQPQPAIFHDIPWSAPDTLARSLAAAARAGLSTALLEPLRDIDDLGDWRAAGL
jgi:rSAM/selenodomain-associated transferase 1